MVFGALLLLAGSTIATRAFGDVEPGDVITKANAEKVQDLTSPGLHWCVQHGLPMRIMAPRARAWPPAYRDATEKYSGQVKLSADGLTLENYVAGAPFPRIDPKDQQVALKIVWNFNYKSINNDDLDFRNFDADTGPIHDDRPMTIERHFIGDHYRRLWYVNRLYVDPKPTWAPNPAGIAYKEMLFPFSEPFDVKGAGFLYYRYQDSARQDDSWIYIRQVGRAKRLSTAERSDALFGLDIDIDSHYGFSGQPAWSEWKYLGQKTILAVLHAEHFPVKRAEPPADWGFDEVWEKVDTYVLEAVSRVPQYNFSKRILYIDKAMFTIPYTDLYDRDGELWKIWLQPTNYAKKPHADANVAVYDYEVPFFPEVVMVDIQLRRATRAAFPGSAFPGEEGFYYNFGDTMGTTDSQLTLAEIVRSGQ
jgi:hypothetical protein